jgi:hypothetical protein
MNSLPEPLYIIRIEEVFWGGTLMAITMALHGLGMLLVLRMAASLRHRFESKPSFLKGLFILILASWMILIVHLVEVSSWSEFFLLTRAVHSANVNRSLCYYFALMDYTTLGSNYNLVQHWRLLEGMIAIAGLLTFAWSTGVLLTLAQDFQDQQLQILKQRREKRHTQAER